MRPSLQSRGAEFLVDVPVLGKDADDVEWYPDRTWRLFVFEYWFFFQSS